MENKIHFLLEKVNDIEDEELSSHLLNYICVLISGYLEKNIENILKEYKNTQHCLHHECKDSLTSMRKIQNAKWCAIRPVFMNIDENILDLLKSEFGLEFDTIIFSINNIVKTRHKIAHGDDVTSLSASILNDDFDKIKQFIQKVQETFDCL